MQCEACPSNCATCGNFKLCSSCTDPKNYILLWQGTDKGLGCLNATLFYCVSGGLNSKCI